MSVLEKTKDLNSLLTDVDEKSRQIIVYLLRERHAEIRKLADLICASFDMEVLVRIREIINPRAFEVIGEPIITFERSKIDPLTGEKITFSWWLKKEWVEGTYWDNLLDVFDEGNGLTVIAFLSPQEENVEVEVKESSLIISGKEYHREIPLHCPVEKKVMKTINNGILEVKLNKVE